MHSVKVPPEHVIVCLGGLGMHENGSPIFSTKVYGPFSKEEAVIRRQEIVNLEGGACLIRPMIDLSDTYRRMSAD